MPQSEEVRAGSVLAGRYELLSVLGRGGMGVVFRARHLGTERPIAVKVLRRELMADPTLAKRFMREAKAAAAIQHPNVVDVLDYGVDTDGTAFQVLELLEGASLGEQLASKTKIPIDVALSLVLPVMHALAVAHARGVLHRDLKPDNVFLARNAHGRIVPKLLDFGIAKLMNQAGAPTSTLATRVGTAIGTPAYMSPEQARGTADVGITTDVWAVGVILFECIAGRIPFEAETGSILMARIIMEQAPSILTVAPETPAALARVIDRALMAKSEDRWPSMAAFTEALREAAAESGIVITPAGASDTAPMSLPPPRTDAERELEPAHAPISSGDELDLVHPATRDRATGPRVKVATQLETRVDRTPLPPKPTSVPVVESEPAPPLPTRSSVLPIVAVSLVVVALVVAFVWMREPAVEPQAPVVASPPIVAPVDPPIEPEVEVEVEEIADVVEVAPPEMPAGVEAPVGPPPGHERRRPLHEPPPAHVDEPPLDEPEHSRGEHLPGLSEW